MLFSFVHLDHRRPQHFEERDRTEMLGPVMAEDFHFDEFGEDFLVADGETLNGLFVLCLEVTDVSPTLGTRVIS